MRILFSWTGVTGYMADCWRALARAEGVDVRVIVETAASGSAFRAEETLRGLACELVEREGAATARLATFGEPFRPDVLFVGGWRSVTTRRVLAHYAGVPAVFCLDMPWRWQLRCLAARFVLARFLRRFAAVYVPGASAARYACYLGFASAQIARGLYAVDQARLGAAAGASVRTGFLFVGRHSPEKRLDLVEEAHRRYRAAGGTWPLSVYGQGGRFVQADGMPAVYAQHACLVLASAFDPWPLVALEARAAGLEVIASARCGNARELGAHEVRYGSAAALAAAMRAVERGARVPRPDLADYDLPAWTARTCALARQVARHAGAECGRIRAQEKRLP